MSNRVDMRKVSRSVAAALEEVSEARAELRRLSLSRGTLPESREAATRLAYATADLKRALEEIGAGVEVEK